MYALKHISMTDAIPVIPELEEAFQKKIDPQQPFFGGFQPLLGGGFKYFLFSPQFWGNDPIWQYFSNGLKPPTRLVFRGVTPFITPLYGGEKKPGKAMYFSAIYRGYKL